VTPVRRPFSDAGFTLIDLMVTVCLIAVVAGMAVPLASGSIGAFRFRGEAQAISNLTGVVKMRAASQFTRARLRVNITARTYGMEVWNKTTNAWVASGGTTTLPFGVSFSFGTLASPPPDTQAAIGFSDVCTDDAGDDIANTACIVFNSRGIPIDGDGQPLGGHGIYLTDGSTGVYGITVTATPLIRFWWSPVDRLAWQELQ
jgi:type II secretory pathway pseudopilin PulG